MRHANGSDISTKQIVSRMVLEYVKIDLAEISTNQGRSKPSLIIVDRIGSYNLERTMDSDDYGMAGVMRALGPEGEASEDNGPSPILTLAGCLQSSSLAIPQKRAMDPHAKKVGPVSCQRMWLFVLNQSCPHEGGQP